ncbi:MAG: hypothetical protein GC154_15865 [bacterium]|nr:hypothetical protein [bacterium]
MLEYCVILVLIVLAGAAPAWLGGWLALLAALIAAPSVYAALFGAPYVPAAEAEVRRMIELARVRPGELAADLGCGDGRLLLAAREAGARVIGYEISLILFCLARWRVGGAVCWSNFWRADLSEVDIVFVYLTPRAMTRFERELWPRLKPGCRVVVNGFPLPTKTPAETAGAVRLYVVS